MARHSSVLIGTAGVYHVASRLAIHGFHAAVTHGNAPSVDILVGHLGGAAALSLQVKTSYQALRTRGRGRDKHPHHYEWDVGEKSARLDHPDLFFAFVDLRSGDERPDVFIVPSRVIHDHFAPYLESGKSSRQRWHPELETISQYEENWDLLQHRFDEKTETL